MMMRRGVLMVLAVLTAALLPTAAVAAVPTGAAGFTALFEAKND
jgi:hypothetical protein